MQNCVCVCACAGKGEPGVSVSENPSAFCAGGVQCRASAAGFGFHGEQWSVTAGTSQSSQSSVEHRAGARTGGAFFYFDDCAKAVQSLPVSYEI